MNSRVRNTAFAKAAGFLRFAAAALAFLAVRAGAEEDRLELLSVISDPEPIISERKVSYKVDFLFDRCPADYWWYYDLSGKGVVIEVYDYFVKVQDTLTVRPAPPVKEIEFKDSSTSLVISGKKSQICLRLREELHCEASCVNDTLRVMLWKELSPSFKNVVKKKRRVPAPLVISGLLVFFCAAMTAVYLRLFIPEK